MTLEEIAKRYFSTINTMANRICIDQNETKSRYKDLWNSLTDDEQDQILSECIIKPEYCLKYHSDNELGTAATNINYGAKMIIDDHYSYRDEHSAPFSLRTDSQRDLTIFGAVPKKTAKGPSSTFITKKEDQMPVPNSLQTHVEVVNHESITIYDSADSLTNFIPKTGLDFLDNW